ncbi:MAG: 4Fe-4S binding protein [Donghicola eburneus]|uniref:4Fe-4S binding protein n=1 Tax=Primorskyibacter sp. 2E233 TaxID=3413431 RepID=UPI0026EDC46C|nr:4Fe-4S binding protein [Donghicola eburneus]MCI5038675.1 4Fe-4S binding protein [Donghicola eburneus]
MRRFLFVLLIASVLTPAFGLNAEPMKRPELSALVIPPYKLGQPVNDKGVYTIVNTAGVDAGYIFETFPLAPIPGFSGAPINMLVTLDLETNILDVRLLDHSEPIFKSGIGEAAFHKYFEQYKGRSITTPMVVGAPFDDQGTAPGQVKLHGIARATASVRIAHESLMGAAMSVAREKMQGVRLGPPPVAVETDDVLSWAQLVEQGIVQRFQVTNGQLQEAFAGTIWAESDSQAEAALDALFIDLWIVDISPPAIARAALSQITQSELARLSELFENDELLLVIEAGRHGLVGDGFVPSGAPDLLKLSQGGFPVSVKDADITLVPHADAPAGKGMILRVDRRLGFDPTEDWKLELLAIRESRSIMPQIGEAAFSVTHKTPERFFERPEIVRPTPPWLEALITRKEDLIGLSLFLVGLIAVLALKQNRLAGLRTFTPIRLTVLAGMTGFVGWWGQGQLSIVTPLAVIRAAVDEGSFAFLLYDPFSLLVWIAAIGGFVWWGRGLFCGWLCPFGALQEFAAKIAAPLKLPQVTPSPVWDKRLRKLKYWVLASMVVVVIYDPAQVDVVSEIEPFKTAITVYFDREWWFVAYAVFWLVLSMVLFKGFCRYVCPLGAVMAIGGLLRQRDWIARRVECGSPCQLCRVKCRYGAIQKSGEILYDECFQCLDCVKIHDDDAQCVPLVLAARARDRIEAA